MFHPIFFAPAAYKQRNHQQIKKQELASHFSQEFLCLEGRVNVM